MTKPNIELRQAECLEKLMPWQMRGARPGGMTLDVARIVELTLEHYWLFNIPAFGYFMDREKCFDRLPWEVMYELEVSAGYPPKWVDADRRYNRELKSAFRFGSAVGEWWTATNSFRQGCSGAVRRVTLLMAIWIRRQTYILPRALIGNFFDDCLVIANSQKERQDSMDQSGTFDTLTGQRVGHKKTIAFSAPQAMNDELISRDERLKSVNAEKAISILMEVHGKSDTSTHDNRLKKVKDVITMIGTLPVPVEKKAELISLKTAGARYGLEITQPSEEVAKAFDKQIMKVIGGPNNQKWRCWDTTVALIWPSHNIFIQTATPYQMIVTANRQIARHGSIQKMFAEVWEQRTRRKMWGGRGVVAGIAKQVKAFEWTWKKPLEICPKECMPISLMCPLKWWFKHQVREALRQAILVKPHNRKDMGGIENGVEYEHTVALIRSKELTCEDQEWLRRILQGNMFTKDRTSHIKTGEAIKKCK